MYLWNINRVSNVSFKQQKLSQFNILGFLIPLVVFIVVIAVPSEDSTDKQKIINIWIVARYFFFALILLGTIIMIVPACKFINTRLIPERVESRSLKDQIDKLIEEERKHLTKNKEQAVNNEAVLQPVIMIDHNNNIVKDNNQEGNALNNENKAALEMKKAKFSTLKRKVENS